LDSGRSGHHFQFTRLSALRDKPWESVVAEVGRPWSDYITPEQRRMLNWVVADVHSEIARAQRLRAQIRADLYSVLAMLAAWYERAGRSGSA